MCVCSQSKHVFEFTSSVPGCFFHCWGSVEGICILQSFAEACSAAQAINLGWCKDGNGGSLQRCFLESRLENPLFLCVCASGNSCGPSRREVSEEKAVIWVVLCQEIAYWESQNVVLKSKCWGDDFSVHLLGPSVSVLVQETGRFWLLMTSAWNILHHHDWSLSFSPS